MRSLLRSIYLSILRPAPVSPEFLLKSSYYKEFEIWRKANTLPAGKRFDDRAKMYAYLNREILKEQPMEYLEFGVYQGASVQLWSEINTHPDTRFFGFDTFEGLPEDWVPDSPEGSYSNEGRIPAIDDARVHFIKGLFQDTLPVFCREFNPQNRLVVHLDADLYSSTLYALSSLDTFMKADTILIFDEFSCFLHEFRALLDYTRAHMRTYEQIAHTDEHVQAAFILR